MADQLFLSLWYPSFRFEALPEALTCVLRQFALVAGAPGKRVAAATVYPISFTESPTYQRLFVNDTRSEDTSASIIENAIAEATEHLHDDMAVEFEMRWNLWTLNPPAASTLAGNRPGQDAEANPNAPLDDNFDDIAPLPPSSLPLAPAGPWTLFPHTVRVLGFGPHFDDAGYEQNGHLRLDFGLDTPWTFEPFGAEEASLDEESSKHIQQNVEMLLALTLSIEKHCGISSRLLWTESGEPLAEKLIARLQRLH